MIGQYKHPHITSHEEYLNLWKYSIENPLAFWHQEAQALPWMTPYNDVWQPPKGQGDAFVGRWFTGGNLNVADICVDRWARSHPDQIAMLYVGEEDSKTTPNRRTITYAQMSLWVNKTANLLRKYGVKKGDSVGVWLPMVPEAIYVQMACAKIGAVGVVVFSGFSAQNAQDRFIAADCRVIVTSDGGRRRGKLFPLRSTLSENFIEHLENIITIEQNALPYARSSKDRVWHEEIEHMSDVCESSPQDAEDPLFILYTSGTTGKPKGIVHTTAGYMVYTMSTMRHIWGIQGLAFGTPQDREVWFCTADIGWITGHSYLSFAPFALGTLVVMYEGVLTYPDQSRLLEIIDSCSVTHLYTAPTLLRQLSTLPQDDIDRHSLQSLRVLGTVGEPINSEAWTWYHEKIGKGRCPIVDTYWQTETGGYIFSPIAGVSKLKAGSCCHPCLGIDPCLITEDGVQPKCGEKGYVCIKQPWPGMMRTIFKDHQRFSSSYLRQDSSVYCTGDEAYQDEEGHYWITGRTDDVIKVAGHRFGSAELEENVTMCRGVVECAAVGIPDTIKGSSIVLFVVSQNVIESEFIKEHVRKTYGPIAVPERVLYVEDLPKTRSGKMMRRMLRNILLGVDVGDTSTLVNPESIKAIAESLKTQDKN